MDQNEPHIWIPRTNFGKVLLSMSYSQNLHILEFFINPVVPGKQARKIHTYFNKFAPKNFRSV